MLTIALFRNNKFILDVILRNVFYKSRYISGISNPKLNVFSI